MPKWSPPRRIVIHRTSHILPMTRPHMSRGRIPQSNPRLIRRTPKRRISSSPSDQRRTRSHSPLIQTEPRTPGAPKRHNNRRPDQRTRQLGSRGKAHKDAHSNQPTPPLIGQGPHTCPNRRHHEHRCDRLKKRHRLGPLNDRADLTSTQRLRQTSPRQRSKRSNVSTRQIRHQQPNQKSGHHTSSQRSQPSRRNPLPKQQLSNPERVSRHRRMPMPQNVIQVAVKITPPNRHIQRLVIVRSRHIEPPKPQQQRRPRSPKPRPVLPHPLQTHTPRHPPNIPGDPRPERSSAPACALTHTLCTLRRMSGPRTAEYPIDGTSHDSEESIVHYPSRAQLDAAVQRELDKVGLNREQLDAQAKAGRFDSELARQIWFCLP